MPGFRWTNKEESALRLALEEGATCGEIAEELGRSYQAVMKKCSALKLKFVAKGPRRNVEKELFIISMVEAGHSVEEAARQMGVKSGSGGCSRAVRRLRAAGVLVRTSKPRHRYEVAKSWTNGSRRSKSWITWTEGERLVLSPNALNKESPCPDH